MKTNNKHTKGPWKVQFRELTGQYHINFNGNNQLMDDNDFKANAALIAAAPEMFEALELALKELKSVSFAMNDKDIKFIEAVLKKARGE